MTTVQAIGGGATNGWAPGRLRAAREAMRDHGRPVSQERFAALVGVSKRTLERYESLSSPQPPKPVALAKIVQVTGRPAEFFFGQGVAPTADPDDFELAIAQMFVRALRPLTARIEELERQQTAEGWDARTGRLTVSPQTARRAA